MRHPAVLVAGILFVLLAIGAYLFFMLAPESAPKLTTLVVGDVSLAAEVASTQSERELGLSGRSGLPEGRAMLFVFDTPGSWGIWMKDMRFSIDVIWADESGSVIKIEERMPPGSYPTAFYPPSPARYVVELPPGFIQSHGIAIGDKIVVQ